MPLMTSLADLPIHNTQAKTNTPFAISTSRKACDEAFNMIDLLGNKAAGQAEHNAHMARDRGNHIYFCFWRDVGRIIASLESENAYGALN